MEKCSFLNDSKKLSNQNKIERTDHIIDLEKDDILNEILDINSISNMHVYDEVGNRHTIGDIWAEFKTIFIFVRV
jgi:hypothetical protein